MTDKPAKLVSVKRFRNEIDANLALIRLECAGIDGFITADDCGGWNGPFMQLVEGVFLRVRDADAEAAKLILTSEPKP